MIIVLFTSREYNIDLWSFLVEITREETTEQRERELSMVGEQVMATTYISASLGSHHLLM